MVTVQFITTTVLDLLEFLHVLNSVPISETLLYHWLPPSVRLTTALVAFIWPAPSGSVTLNERNIVVVPVAVGSTLNWLLPREVVMFVMVIVGFLLEIASWI